MASPGWRIEPIPEYISDHDDAGTLIVEPGTPLDSLPAPFADIVTPEHRRAMASPGRYFEELAAECELRGLSAWLKSLAAAEKWELHLSWIPPPCGGSESGIKVYQRGETLPYCVRLRTPLAGAQFPKSLRAVYSVINGSYGFPFEAGGFLEHENSRLSIDGWNLLPPVLVQNPQDLVSFYSDGTGDAMVAEGDRAVWLLHETGGFLDVGPLDAVVDNYFQSQIDRTPWPIPRWDPYALWRERNPGRRD
jgi:hypothetical protein